MVAIIIEKEISISMEQSLSVYYILYSEGPFSEYADNYGSYREGGIIANNNSIWSHPRLRTLGIQNLVNYM